jgi:DNA-binding beta-propeller fold protein YncE
MRPLIFSSLGSLFFFFGIASLARADKIVLIAGGGTAEDGAQAAQAKLLTPFGVAFDGSGNLYLVEYTGQRVRRIDSKGVISTIAGSGRKGSAGVGSPAKEAEFDSPHNLAVTPNGDIFVADTMNNRVVKIESRSGLLTVVAGTGEHGFSGDGGPATKARFGNIYCATLDPRGERLYLADLDNRRIRVVDLGTGVVTSVAGNGKKGVPHDDGAVAVDAPLVDPRAVTADAKGNIYILERSGHALRVVDRQGKIRTIAGTGKAGAAGDGGNARTATLNGPKHLCIDADGNVIIADTENHAIRKVIVVEGKIVRVAGTGKKGAAAIDGSPLEAELNQPHGVYIHPTTGDLYIADSSNNRVLKIERSP